MPTIHKRKLSYIRFLLNVLLIAVTAFGGPQAHLLTMQDILVKKRKYLTNKDLLELNALCQLLPGPTSTQTITAIGYKLGGLPLALITIFIWIMPACILMTLFAVFYLKINQAAVNTNFLRFLQPISIAFVLAAAYRLGQKNLTKPLYVALAIAALVVSVVFVSPYMYPLALLLGGMAAYYFQQNQFVKQKVNLTIKYKLLYIYFGLLLVSAIVGTTAQYRPALLFENTYRFGSLVFGGGQVLIPMLYDQFVLQKHYLTSQEFLTGYGIAQAIPGPVFAFSCYVNALALQKNDIYSIIGGAGIGAIAIFTPGALLVFFVYPIWQQVKTYQGLQKALEGVTAAAVGLIVASAVLLLKNMQLTTQYLIGTIVVFLLLIFTNTPSWLVVIFALVAGFVLA